MKIDTVKDSPTSNGPNVSVRKTAYCDAHTPPDSDSRPLVSSAGDYSLGETLRKAQSKAVFREKMRKARKILAEKRSAAPIVSIPTIPPDRVQEIASTMQVQGKIRLAQKPDIRLGIRNESAFVKLKRQIHPAIDCLLDPETAVAQRRPTVAPLTNDASVTEAQLVSGKRRQRRRHPAGRF